MRSFIALALFFFVTNSLFGQEWTRFRGPNGTGAGKADIPIEWTDSDYAWKVELTGVGHSSPVVWGNKVFLMSADPKDATRYVICIDAENGNRLWTREFASETHHLHNRSSYASCTPAADADHVYVAWSTPTETLFKAFDHAGNEKWSLDLGRWVSQHGFGASPIVYKDMVILHNSQQASKLKPGTKPGDSFMMAFDRKTGNKIWSTPLVSRNVCYSVPFIHRADGSDTDELICTSTGNGVFSLNPKDGKENWSIDVFKMRTVGSPIFAGGHVFNGTGSGAYAGNYIVAVKPGQKPELAYELKNSGKFKAPYVPSMISKGDSVFALYDRGFASCIDAPTGKINWFVRTGASFSGSPVRIDNRIYAIDEDGVVWVIAADDSEFKVLAKNDLGEESRSTPAISGGKMFLRTYSHLFCLGEKS